MLEGPSFLSLNKGDYTGALRWCEGAEADFGTSCANGVETQTMKENMSDPELVEATCMKGKPEQIKPCIEGMAGVYVFHEASLEPARALCGRLEDSNRQACSDSVEEKASLSEARPPAPRPYFTSSHPAGLVVPVKLRGWTPIPACEMVRSDGSTP